MEVAGLIIGLLPQITSNYETQKNLFRSRKGLIGLKDLEWDLRFGSKKFKMWNERWLGHKDWRDSHSEALWGAEASENVQRLL